MMVSGLTPEESMRSPAEVRQAYLASKSDERLKSTMEVLQECSDEAHPGHQPGGFVSLGRQFDGMEYDEKAMRWRMRNDALHGRGADVREVLASLEDQDQVLATRFEAEGGLALCLSRAFSLPNELRAEAQWTLESSEAEASTSVRSDGWHHVHAELEREGSKNPHERAALLLQAADFAEDREAVMRNTWSEVDFQEGEQRNAELVARLEMQFAGQLVRVAEKRAGLGVASSSPLPIEQVLNLRENRGEGQGSDGVFDVALRGCTQASELTNRVTGEELSATLFEARNLGVALDLIGVYLKNYEIIKADAVLNRIVPLCRLKGGPWLMKALDKTCAVRMKQHRAYDALTALKELESLVPFTAEEGWEFHDMLYRNFAWVYSAIDETEKCLEYTRKAVEVKRANNVLATWFDCWDMAKAHARLGQQSNRREEMILGFDLCQKAAEIHRKAEPNDRVMLAKILSNTGEVALGIGDSLQQEGKHSDALQWYGDAEPPLRESYSLHAGGLGTMKPLSGWQAGVLAHCLVRQERWEEARVYVALALKVECTKDATTPGSVVELIDRVMTVHHELSNMVGLAEYKGDLQLVLESLRLRGAHREEPDAFALLLQKVSTLFLASDTTGMMISRAVQLLREAQTLLEKESGNAWSGNAVMTPGNITSISMATDGTSKDHVVDARVKGTITIADEEVVVRQFGPRVDRADLLRQLSCSIRILEFGEAALNDGDSGFT